MNRLRTAVVSTALLAVVGGAAGCSSSGAADSGPSAAAPPATGGTATSAPATPVGTATAHTGAADTTAADSGATSGSTVGSDGASGPSRCAESQLRANVTTNDIPGLARHVVRLTFLNRSSSACTLTGFPGAAVEDASGKQVVQAKRVIGGPVGGTIEKSATLTLRAGATVYAYLEGSSTRDQGAAQAGCDDTRYPRILVTPPNTTTPVPFTVGWPRCYSFDIHPVRTDA